MSFNKQNILVIDNDESINYQKSVIANTAKHKLTLSELQSIFKENNEDIFKYDTTGCFTLILETGKEISLHKYRNQDILFFRLQDNILENNKSDILFSLRHSLSYIHTYQWQNKMKQITDVPKYNSFIQNRPADPVKYIYGVSSINADGYKNTQNLIKASKSDKKVGKVDAAFYSSLLAIKLNDIVYQGYLPSLYQMCIFIKYLEIVNYICFKKYHQGINGDASYWTSNEVNNEKAWSIGGYPNIYCNYKHAQQYVITFFKKL